MKNYKIDTAKKRVTPIIIGFGIAAIATYLFTTDKGKKAGKKIGKKAGKEWRTLKSELPTSKEVTNLKDEIIESVYSAVTTGINDLVERIKRK